MYVNKYVKYILHIVDYVNPLTFHTYTLNKLIQPEHLNRSVLVTNLRL